MLTFIDLFVQQPAQLAGLAPAEGVGVMFEVVAFLDEQLDQLAAALGQLGQQPASF